MEHDQTWHITRAHAERSSCPECHAPSGSHCTRKGPDGKRVPVESFPAHPMRIRKAAKTQAQENQK